MDRKSMQKLRMDRRLIGRANWIPKDELERELAALPDASDKVAHREEAGDGASAEASSPGPAPSSGE